MNFDFERILFYIVVVSGVITLFDYLFLAKKRILNYQQSKDKIAQPSELKLPLIIDYARSFFPIVLIVFLLRSFLFEPFRIPTGSLEPTLLVGDFIIVNKFTYGIRLPLLRTKVWENHQPEHGDIFVFRYPLNPSMYFIKRVIGLPGDHIRYINKELTVNGKKIPQTYIKDEVRITEDGDTQNVQLKDEQFFEHNHHIWIVPDAYSKDFNDIVVPEGMYFAMGDNRDNSGDSREWGFVPEKNIVGKAEVIAFSWDSYNQTDKWYEFWKWGKLIRWHRFGQWIN
jgi:signal peptidase I